MPRVLSYDVPQRASVDVSIAAAVNMLTGHGLEKKGAQVLSSTFDGMRGRGRAGGYFARRLQKPPVPSHLNRGGRFASYSEAGPRRPVGAVVTRNAPHDGGNAALHPTAR